MLLKVSIPKTIIFIHKTLKNLKPFCFRNPKLKTSTDSPSYSKLEDVSSKSDSNQENTNDKEETTVLHKKETTIKEVSTVGVKCKQEKRQTLKKQNKKVKQEGVGYVLAEKLKELEMLDMNDVEHVFDVEEALQCYSRLKSPEYVDIVDSFFMDMYFEFSAEHVPVSSSVNISKRRGGSFRL